VNRHVPSGWRCGSTPAILPAGFTPGQLPEGQQAKSPSALAPRSTTCWTGAHPARPAGRLLGGAVRAGGGRQPAVPVAAAAPGVLGWLVLLLPPGLARAFAFVLFAHRLGAASGLVLARLALALPDQAADVGPIRRDHHPGPGRSPRQPTAVPGVGLPCQPQRPGPGLAPPGCLVGRLIQYSRLRALLGSAELAFFHGGGPVERGRRTSSGSQGAEASRRG
jgi:hypothetical protein